MTNSCHQVRVANLCCHQEGISKLCWSGTETSLTRLYKVRGQDRSKVKFDHAGHVNLASTIQQPWVTFKSEPNFIAQSKMSIFWIDIVHHFKQS